jgi:hypothetical protein
MVLVEKQRGRAWKTPSPVLHFSKTIRRQWPIVVCKRVKPRRVVARHRSTYAVVVEVHRQPIAAGNDRKRCYAERQTHFVVACYSLAIVVRCARD